MPPKNIFIAIAMAKNEKPKEEPKPESKPMFADAKVGNKIWDSLRDEFVTITTTNSLSRDYPIGILYNNGAYDYITPNGSLDTSDKNPRFYWDRFTIVPPARPKQKVKKIVEKWVNIYPNDKLYAVHSSETAANSYAAEDRIACVKLTGEYETYE